jgi:3-hydroxyisobutyrate dehydrogenase-like beta-hydroxyacid dehydrogenase
MGEIPVIGLVQPGEMGAAVGGCLTGAGHRVVWASAGRSPATAARAAGAGLRDVVSLRALAGQAEVILSICPPQAAVEVARSVAGFRGVYLDANAVSPATAARIAGVVTAAGASYVDGGIVGPPPHTPGTTRLYLSGPRATEVARLFGGTAVDTIVLGDRIGAASALKMAYAAWTKGTAALLLNIRALARAEHIEQFLLAEWQQSQPALPGRSLAAAGSAAAKAWRWTSEMQEIAASMAAHGLPSGFHEAAATTYSRLPPPATPVSATEATLNQVIGTLLAGGVAATGPPGSATAGPQHRTAGE